MIASERTQNVIVVTVIIVAVVSSGLIAGNSAYYGGSYSLAARLNVSLLEIRVSSIDHDNESTVDPRIRLTFNIVTSSVSEGNVRLTFIGATVWLNLDKLGYTPFSQTPPVDEQYLYPDFNKNYTLNKPAISDDKQTILDADLSGQWNWYVEFRYSAIVFDQRGTIEFSYIYFNSTVMNLETTFG